MIHPIQTHDAPEAIGPYSQAQKVGNLVFTSGQIALDPQTGKVISSDIEAQTVQVLENLKAVLTAAGTSLDNAVKVTVYLADMKHFGLVNEIYAEYFTNKPARSTVEVSSLPLGVKIEIDVIAALE